MFTRLKPAIAGLTLLLAGTASAQTAPAPAPAPAPSPAVHATPALWVVKDADTTIYLFGTIHILKPGIDWFNGPVRQAFDLSDTVALEMVQPPPSEMQQLVLSKAVSGGHPTLTEQLPQDKRAAFAAALTDVGIPATGLDLMRPWFAATTLTMLPLQKLGYDPASGVEASLTATAATQKKPVIGLETAAQQIGYLDGLSPPTQLAFLTSTIDELPRLGSEIETMVDEWTRGDADALARDMNDDLQATPELAKTLLADRNARWAKWIEERLKSPGTVFIAVGAGHLAGAQSVQNALARDGVTATRVAR